MDDDEELEEFVREESFVYEEIDMDYEFDAARFYDFTRAETDSEAGEAERWFESARGYPPSPFIMRLNRQKGIPVGVEYTSDKSEDLKTNNRGYTNHITKAKAKCPVKSSISRGSTLMKPTASHLVKQNQLRLVHSIRSLRFQKKLGNVIDDKSSQHSSVTTDELATKRQKLEAGFLSKVAQLKHHALLLHKLPKKLPHDGISTNAKPKRVTIPREPDLATSHRAERRRNRINAELGEPTKSNAHTFKARPLNTKILKAPLTLLRKSEPQLLEFQLFRLKTSERAMQNTTDSETNISYHSSQGAEEKRSNSVKGSRQDKCETIFNFEDCSPKEKTLAHDGKFCIYRNIKQRFNFPTGKRFQDEPPINLFSKLCLASEDQQNTRPRSESPLPIKATRQKTPCPLNRKNKVVNVVKERSQRLGGMDFVDCGRHRRIHDLQLYINRSQDIC